ncbi:MAG: hypothetical protein WCX24_03290 [Candidatus Paceibacterota bacterium]
MDIIGHEKQKAILQRIVEQGNIPHALLFSGPEKVGKKKIALEFAKMIFKEASDIDLIENPDFFMVSSVGREIKIEQIRQLQEKLSLKPYSHSFKIGIIDNAHLMKKEVQSAFLKTLEEPRGNSVLILVTPYPHMLLGTIRSRLQELKFSLVPREDIEKHLVELGASESKAKEISLISSGQIGKAVDYFHSPEKMEIFNQALKDIAFLSRADYHQRFNYAKKMCELENIDEIIDIWERFFRREMILEAMKKDSLKETTEIIKNIERSRFLINSTNANKKLVLKNLFLRI